MGTWTSRILWLAAGVVVAALAWWVTGLAPFTTTSTVVVVGSGAAVMVAARLLRPRSRPATEAPLLKVGVVAWVVLIAALVSAELAAFVQSPRDDHPTLSSLNDALLEAHPVRALAYVGWLVAAGWLAR